MREIEFKVTKKNPKEDAISYKITTIEELFDMLTVDNVNKFVEEFGELAAMIVGVKSFVPTTPLVVTHIDFIDD